MATTTNSGYADHSNARFEHLADQATILVDVPTVNSRGQIVAHDWESGVSISKLGALVVRETLEKLRMYLDDQSFDDIQAELFEHFEIK